MICDDCLRDDCPDRPIVEVAGSRLLACRFRVTKEDEDAMR